MNTSNRNFNHQQEQEFDEGLKTHAKELFLSPNKGHKNLCLFYEDITFNCSSFQINSQHNPMIVNSQIVTEQDLFRLNLELTRRIAKLESVVEELSKEVDRLVLKEQFNELDISSRQ